MQRLGAAMTTSAHNIGDLDDRSLAEAIERKRRLLVIATGEGRDDIEDELSDLVREQDARPLRASDRPDYMELSAAQEAEIEGEADPMQPMYDEQDAEAIEEDRRFEQMRDERITARRERHG